MRLRPIVILAFPIALVLTPAHASREGAPDPRDAPLLEACGEGNAALADAASKLARRHLEGAPLPASDELAEDLRAAGDSHPWPRLLAFRSAKIDREHAVSRVKRWAREISGDGMRRCGIASVADEQGHEALVIVAVPVLAELTPLPKTARVGTWITVEAQLRPNVESPRVVVLGPKGAPRSIPSSLRDDHVVARFSADHAGLWLVQVVADGDSGPRPVVEGSVRVGGSETSENAVPGDDVSESTPEATLAEMVRVARASEGATRLTRSPALDELARAHAERMAKTGKLAHDAGDGDPFQRVTDSGIEADEVGENVAHAGTLAHAHRVIWASPSHRENLLAPRWRETGVGVAKGKDGSLWVVELFLH